MQTARVSPKILRSHSHPSDFVDSRVLPQDDNVHFGFNDVHVVSGSGRRPRDQSAWEDFGMAIFSASGVKSSPGLIKRSISKLYCLS